MCHHRAGGGGGSGGAGAAGWGEEGLHLCHTAAFFTLLLTKCPEVPGEVTTPRVCFISERASACRQRDHMTMKVASK